ncbi:MAG: hypothetical protein GY856_32465, partial [bacterium]|nr:hypothetical protein [bacterium]
MSDNTHICRVEVALFHLEDGTYVEVPGGGLLATFDEGTGCALPGVQAGSVEYTLPTVPPGNVTSQYKIQLQVTDHAGNTTVVLSARPFSIASPNPDAVKTLILANVPRMEVMASISPVDAAELEGKLQDLANHDDVKGFVIHLEDSTNLYPLYAAWDADPGDWAKANAVLFDPQVGIHQVVRQWLGAFPGVEYVIVVGDDRIIPMARIYDRTVLLPEPSYPTDTPDDNSDLTTTGTTVGRALAANRYLSDDLLAVLDPILPDEVDSGTYIPDLALGRLVETPQEIIQAITVFLNQNGILDLTALDPDYGHKVLVTGYDFLIDSAKRVCTQWKAGFGVTRSCPGDELEPIDGKLIGPTWDEPTVEARRQAFLTHLGGNGGERYGIANLNGHATHYEAGVPGTDRAHIAGVDAADLYNLDLAGSVLYAVGCHGGLSVAGSDDPFDHPLDLPQTMLAAGVQTYVANTGYGWGLLHGIGFSERLVEIFTARLMEGETVAAGKAVVRAKLGYYLDSFCPDLDDEQRLGPYGEKTIMQWALFGFPMYAVKLGTGSGGSAAGTGLFDSAPGERPAEEHLAGVTVTRELAGSAVNGVSTLPPFLTRLDLRFELAAPGLYTKYNASGDVLGDPFDPIHPPAPGCPDPPGGGPEGCYYTLNGLSTEVADVPIQPYLAYDSRLSGTSAHGLLWKGGTYREEDGWTPVFAQLASNQEQDYTDHGSAPRTIIIRPRALRRRAGSLDGPDCTSADLEVSSIVLATGETLRTPATAIYDVERLYQDVDLEVLYFNNTQGGAGNCDRLGPELLCGSSDDPCHEAVGPTIEWAVPATDDGGVWRVLVVYTDNTVDADGRGTWVPLELTADGTGTWRGSVTFPEVPLVTYVVQAVDLRGNVTWLDYVTSDQPESGVPFDLPETVDVELVAGAADLSVTLAVAPDPVVAGDPLRYTIAIDNLGPDTSISPEAELTLPAGTAFGLAAGDGWSCTEDAGVVFCERETLPIGVAPPITVLAQAPPGSGILIATVEVRAMNDPNTSNNFDTASTRLIDDESTDLAVVKEDGGVPAEPGQPITYSIYVFNHGPSAVNGAGVEDLFPAELHDVVWSCLATVGSSCTPSGVGDIVDEVGLEPQGAVLYTATAIVDVNATGWIANTATVSSPVADRDLANNQSQARTPIRFMMSPTEWKATGDLRDERHRHTATLLPSGKLLVAGGESGGDLSSTELYDPSTGTWESTGGLVTPRHSYTATLLPSGKVLATGGSNAGGHLSSTELYDPSTGTWESIGGLATPRGRHTATLLPAGKVLVTGGSNAGGALSSAELYDPSTGTWETTGSFVTPRHAHTATLLPSGKVLIAGGVNAGGYLSSAEVYDPSTGTWETTGSLVTPRDYY